MSLKIFLNLPASYLVQHMLGVVVLQFCVYNHRNLHLLDDLWPSQISKQMCEFNESNEFTFHISLSSSKFSIFIHLSLLRMTDPSSVLGARHIWTQLNEDIMMRMQP